MLGYYDYLVASTYPNPDQTQMLKVAPNPAVDTFRFEFQGLNSNATLMIFDMGGRLVCEQPWRKGENQLQWDATTAPAGHYQAVLVVNKKRLASIGIIKGD